MRKNLIKYIFWNKINNKTYKYCNLESFPSSGGIEPSTLLVYTKLLKYKNNK